MQLIQQGFLTGKGRSSKLMELMMAIGAGKVDVFISDEMDAKDFINKAMTLGLTKVNELEGVTFTHSQDVQERLDMLLTHKRIFPTDQIRFILIHSIKPVNVDKFDDVENVIVINYVQANKPLYQRIADSL